MPIQNIDLEQLIDSALAKDASNIPVLPAKPDPSLIAGLGAKTPMNSALGASSQTGLFSVGVKMMLGFIAIVGAGIAAYIFITPTTHEAPRTPTQTIAAPLDTLKKPQTDTIINGIRQQKTIAQKPTPIAPQGATTDTLATTQKKPFNATDLNPPITTHKDKEGLQVPIQK